MEVYWEVAPMKDFDIHQLTDLGPIVYGKVPEGFRQYGPKSGAPPPICEGGPYLVEIHIRNGSGVSTSFLIRNGKIELEPHAAD